MMTDKIIWRLKQQPTAESLNQLVASGILNKDEAKQILVSFQSEEDRDKRSLEIEIEFLRKLVDNLSHNNSPRIVEGIKEVIVERPYWEKQPWYGPYSTWCTTSTGLTSATSGGTMVGSESSITNATFSSIGEAGKGTN